MKSKPAGHSTDFSAIPWELKARPQWVCWRKETRHGRPTKLPYRPIKGLFMAESNNPESWGTYEEAFARARQAPPMDGIGYVFAADDPYCGIDLDKCIDPETGEIIKPWAEAAIQSLNSYTELSPSGTGFHILARARLPGDGHNDQKAGREMYDHGRYFTMTGQHWAASPATIEKRQSEVENLYREWWPPSKPKAPAPSPAVSLSLSDFDLIEKARQAENGRKFEALWTGDTSHYGDDHSAADMALCKMLAFWTNRDPTRIDRLFRQSRLFREKWDERRGERGTYGQITIDKAIDSTPEGYTGLTKGKTEGAETDNPGFFPLTDTGNAERLIYRHGENLRYCYEWGKWLVWSGTHWELDAGGKVQSFAKDTVRLMYAEAANTLDDGIRKSMAAHARKSEASSRRAAMIQLAQSEPGIPVSPSDLDANLWLLNCLNGVVDLRTGTLSAHRRTDLMTKRVDIAYRPEAQAPTWQAFLARIFEDNQALITFVQKAIGYALTGDVSEQCFFILHGSGQNGKSTLLTLVQKILGQYAKQAAPELLMAKRSSHPTELADLRGARAVVAVESDKKHRLAESLVKQLTGGDRIKARFLHQDFFEFDPTHKLFLATNHKPEIKGTDYAIWRRIRLIPFTVEIPKAEQDKRMADRLLAELPGILAWAVSGCLAWQREGLEPPAEVIAATEGYRAEMDVLAAFLDECCILSADKKATAKEIYSAYVEWCNANGEKPETQRAFGMSLSERGFSRVRHGKGYLWHGIGVLDSSLLSSNLVNQVNHSEPEIHKVGENFSHEGNIGKHGSLGSLGSPIQGANTPIRCLDCTHWRGTPSFSGWCELKRVELGKHDPHEPLLCEEFTADE